MTIEEQIVMVGQELERRTKFVYRWKNRLNRKFGWFKKWGEERKFEYKKKYPKLYSNET